MSEAQIALEQTQELTVPARTVHLPLSWDDEVCQQAIEKYDQSVRKNAPWAPSNLEFIRRINGLDSIEDVKKIVFEAQYLVMGLGDVYLGAPVATPLDPRHRLVTTKYNPARTWTAENSVGIGGSYLCIYGMEGPGGYQFVGRTLQMWNRFKTTPEFSQPWLLRFFDRIQFYEVSGEELKTIRQQFPNGQYPLKIEENSFSLNEYQEFLEQQADSIAQFNQHRQHAFDEELQRWREQGQFHFEVDTAQQKMDAEHTLAEHEFAIESPVAGNVWKRLCEPGSAINKGEVVMIIESMKMEIEVFAPQAGTLKTWRVNEGDQISSGDVLCVIEEEK